MVKVHPTAIVSPKAELADDVEIGPYAIIEEDVVIGKGTKIGPFTIIKKFSRIGENNDIHSNVLIGGLPQDIEFKDVPSYVEIGNNNVIREFVTVHRSKFENGKTIIGNNCFIMACAHVAHDVVIGNRVILVNYAGLSGHIVVEDDAFISGLCGLHQFIRIGRLAMIGGVSRVPQDVPPFVMVAGNPCYAMGLNIVGLRRKGVPAEVRSELKKAYKILYFESKTVQEAVERIKSELKPFEEVKHFADFVAESKRGIVRPRFEGKSE